MPKKSTRLMDGGTRDRKRPHIPEEERVDLVEEDLETSYEGSELEYTESSSSRHTSNDIEDCFARDSSLEVEMTSESPPADFIGNVFAHIYDCSTISETLQLYIRFLRGQITSYNLQIPEILNITFRNDLTKQVRTLRMLAARFSVLPQRKDLYSLAQRVDVDTLNYENFQALLKGLFEKGGLTYEKVIVLFYFCSDLSIRVLKERLIFNYFRNILNWTLRYIQDHLCHWVEQQGGWNAILPRGFDNDSVVKLTHLTLIGVGILGIIAICIYFRNKSNK